VVVVDATNLGGSLSAAKQPVHMQSNSTQDLFITWNVAISCRVL